MSIKEIKIEDLQISPLNVRSILKDDIDELSENINQQGLLNPLTVVYNQKSNKYEIIAGQRRYLAIKKLNHPTILCNVVDKSDQDCIFISIVENVQRNTMKLSDKVKMYQKLHNNFSSIPQSKMQTVLSNNKSVSLTMLDGPKSYYFIFGYKKEILKLYDEIYSTEIKPCNWNEVHIDNIIPNIFNETQDLYIPQSVNLDLIGAVNFKKGCSK